MKGKRAEEEENVHGASRASSTSRTQLRQWTVKTALRALWGGGVPRAFARCPRGLQVALAGGGWVGGHRHVNVNG